MIGNKEAWMKADDDVAGDLGHYMSLHDAKMRLAELCEIALFPNEDLQTTKMTKAERYELMQRKVLGWFEFEVNKRAEDITSE